MSKIAKLNFAGSCLITAAIISLFLGGSSPEEQPVPSGREGDSIKSSSRLSLITTVPDLSACSNVREKKEEFFGFLRPVVEAENARIVDQREKLLELHNKSGSGGNLSTGEFRWLQEISAQYEAGDPAPHRESWWRLMTRRMDIIPTPLALVQAAMESGWGTSRFAREGNNLFGQWCFNRNRGLIPRRRKPGSNHLVATFPTVNESVRSYMRNLNTNAAYREFRALRAERREKDNLTNGYQLAGLLHNYSERRDEYVQKLQMIMRVNRQLLQVSIQEGEDYCQVPTAEQVPGREPEVPAAGTLD